MIMIDEIDDPSLVWTVAPTAIPNSLYLSSKPGWFGNLSWPPIAPENPQTDDPTIIAAGYRYVYGTEVPGVDQDGLAIINQRFTAS